MTPEEQEQRVLYANILEYEQDHVRVYSSIVCSLYLWIHVFNKKALSNLTVKCLMFHSAGLA